MSGINAVKSSVDESKSQTPNPIGTETGNLDQIRDILFGAQVQQYDEQFLRLESQFNEEMKQMRREMVEQFADLKKMLGQTNADMIERLNVEKQQRADSQSELSNTLQETSKALQSRIDQGEQDIKARMEVQLTELRKDMDEQHQAAVTSTERMIAELKNQKANSKDLSSLFAEISSRLSGTQKEATASNFSEKKS